MRMKFLVLFLSIYGLTIIVGDDGILDNEIDTNEGIEHVHQKKLTLGELFNKAVQAYLDEDWDSCIERFNEAIYRYKLHRRTVINCRQKCKSEASSSKPSFPENFDDMHFYEKKLRETLCLLKCNHMYNESLEYGDQKRLSIALENKFLEYRPYEYLHICYYQKKLYQRAADASFTFLVHHPDHEMSIKNLQFYLELPGVEKEKIVDLEAAPFLKMYNAGIQAYEDEFYEEAVRYFENSLSSYFETEDACRMYCEGPFDQGWYPEFTASISNHFTYCLKCKRWCSNVLNNVNGKDRSDLLSNHYDYLQFAYYKLGKLEKACAAVESFLLFKPADETMLHNKDFYSKLPYVNEDFFTPRKETVKYVKRHSYEWRILRYITEEFSEIEAKPLPKNEEEELEEKGIEKGLAKDDARTNLTLQDRL